MLRLRCCLVGSHGIFDGYLSKSLSKNAAPAFMCYLETQVLKWMKRIEAIPFQEEVRPIALGPDVASRDSFASFSSSMILPFPSSRLFHYCHTTQCSSTTKLLRQGDFFYVHHQP